MLTKNQLVAELQKLADSHLQINGFGYGPEALIDVSLGTETGADLGLSTPQKMPFMWVTPPTVNIAAGSLVYNFEILTGDLPGDTPQSNIEVESDTLLVCLDIVSKLSDENYPWLLIKQGTIQPFYSRPDFNYTGHRMQVSLEVPFNYDYCIIPKQ